MQQEDWRGHLQDLWVRSPRYRIIIMVSSGVVTILLLCGLCNTLGSLTSGILASALTSNPILSASRSKHDATGRTISANAAVGVMKRSAWA